MKRTLFSRALRTFAAIAVVAGFGATQLQAEPDVTARRNRRGFNLFASSTVVLNGNRVQCGLDNQGNTCANVFGSPTGGGGFWPLGSVNQYIYNGGLQLAGILPADLPVWAGDTVGAYIFDARGNQAQGEQLTLIYNSLDPGDVANWPTSAYVRDANVYNPALLGRLAISQQDSWVRYWDGNADLLSGRTHPMGVMIEQRTLAWNYPTGNEDIIYIVYDFVNITSGRASDYDGLRAQCEASKDQAADPAVQGNIDCTAYAAEVAAIGAAYQDGIQTKLGVDLPDEGYRIDSLYAAFAIDPDVGQNAAVNSSTAILPFNMGVAYKSDFDEPTWFYPPDINGAPFSAQPGYIGVKYLQSPIDPATMQQVGLTMFSNTENPGTATLFPDALGVSQLWRYLSGSVTALEGDRVCSIPNPRANRLCALVQPATDTRFYQASGPFSLEPGQGATIVVAFVHAAPLAAPIAAFGPGNQMQPGIPSNGTQIFQDGANALNQTTSLTLRPLEFSAGWVSHNDDDLSSSIEQGEVTTAPRSLLSKALVAQGIFDANFLLPFAPEPPNFFLIPGDNQVTVIWAPSETVNVGDPFFAIAGNPTSALYDANYRQFDVEGYRIYRGRTGADLELLAQFDAAGTVFTDRRGAWDYGSGCAPELLAGYDDDVVATCPVDWSRERTNPALGPQGSDAADEFVDHDISGDMPQVALPGRAALLTGGTLLLEGKLDTFWPDFEASGGAGLTNTGVPFAFVDTDVINSTDYYYSVTAFDVNSFNSGPSSLESTVISTLVVPRAPTRGEVLPTLVTSITGDDGVELNPRAPVPAIDPETGIFAGMMPPTDAFTTGFAPVVERLLPTLDASVTIDSIITYASSNIAGGTQENPSPECALVENTGGRAASPFGACWAMFLTVDTGTPVTQVVRGYNPWWGAFGEPAQIGGPAVRAAIPLDQTSLDAFGVEGAFTSNMAIDWSTSEGINNSNSQGAQARRFGTFHGGSRWFDGDTEAGDVNTIVDPARFIRAGSLTGVDTVFAVISHTPPEAGQAAPGNANSFEKNCYYRGLGFMGRMADTRFTWSGGTFSEVRDVTHHVPVPFRPTAGISWGFLTTDANGNGVIDWNDFNYIDGAHQIIRNVDGGNCDAAGGGRWDPAGAFATVQLVDTPSLVATSTQGLTTAFTPGGVAATGMGFGIYINGERYIMEMTSLPGDGTTWTLRTYKGGISVDDETAADPSGYTYTTTASGNGGLRPALIPGLRFNFTIASATQLNPVTQDDLEFVHTVPDPYYITSSLERTASQKVIKFVNLPPQANIRIYSVSGVLVDVISHDDVSGGGEAVWDVRNRNNQFVASGVYFFHVETPEGLERVGRFTVVNSSGITTGGAR